VSPSASSTHAEAPFTPSRTDTTTQTPPAPRAFLLVRHRDVSGVSGTGTVAEGTQWSDGSASLRWYGEYPSVAFWQSGIPAIVAVHGHDGATQIRFLPFDPPVQPPSR
jgi:hypothetical protein